MKKFLRGPAEWLAAIGVLLAISSLLVDVSSLLHKEEWSQRLGIIGLACFLAGIVTALARLRDFVDRFDSLAAAGQAALQYGAAVSVIAEALSDAWTDRSGRSAHLQAGGKALGRYALQILPDRARQLRALGPESRVTVVEYHFTTDFLRQLVECMAQGSSWLGITHLTEGWLVQSAQPGYRDFVSAMQERCRQGKLRALRIYCYRDPSELDELRIHLENEVQAGLIVRTLPLIKLAPPDLTLLWPPTTHGPKRFSQETLDPEELLGLKATRPICGMEFTTAGGRLIKQFEIFSSESVQVQALRQQFVAAWKAADSFPSA